MEPAESNFLDNESRADNADVQRLVHCLQSLLEGQSAIDDLVACGPRAIPSLAELLLAGRIVSVPEPRVWAVEALGRLRARDVLIEYVEAPSRTSDPQLFMAEDAVKNAAARWLGSWRDERTFEVLLGLCRKRNLVGAIEALGGFERVDGIPCFDRALEDGMCRMAAEGALRRLGARARPALILSAISPLPNADEETPSSLIRRRTVLNIVADLGVGTNDWIELRPLLAEHDPEILVRIAIIASTAANSADRSQAASRLLEVLPRIPWHASKDAEQALLALNPESVAPLTTERHRRSSASAGTRAADEVLRMLLRLEEKLRK